MNDLPSNFYTTERLNTESPEEQKIGLPPATHGLENGIPRGQMMTFCSKPHYDSMLNWVSAIRRTASEGKRIMVPPKYLPSFKCEVLKGRPVEEAQKFAADYVVQITSLDWTPSYQGQAESRVLRRRIMHAALATKPYASRNEREGVYNFKVGGRHTRKRRAPKVFMLDMNAESLQRIKD